MITSYSFSEEIESTEILVEQGKNVTFEEIQEEEEIKSKEQILPSQVKGMHLTVFAAASQFHKTRTNDLLDNTDLILQQYPVFYLIYRMLKVEVCMQ